MSVGQLQARLEDWQLQAAAATADELGSPELRLLTIGCPTSIAGVRDCGDELALVVSGVRRLEGQPAERQIVIAPVRLRPGSNAAVRFVMFSSDRANGHLEVTRGGTVAGDAAWFTQEPSWLSGVQNTNVSVFLRWRSQ